jgi:hypothetical protein
VDGLNPGDSTAVAPTPSDGDVPRWARWFVHGLLGVVLLCGLARLELFPMSAFKLFSGIRHEQHESWQIRAVAGGEETPVLLGDLPVAYRNTSYILGDFDEMAAEERDAVCRAWVKPARDRGARVDLVRVYRVTASVRPDGPPASRELRWECGRP